jgi:hypothetical protein
MEMLKGITFKEKKNESMWKHIFRFRKQWNIIGSVNMWGNVNTLTIQRWWCSMAYDVQWYILEIKYNVTAYKLKNITALSYKIL